MKLLLVLLAILCCNDSLLRAQESDTLNNNDFSVKLEEHDWVEDGYYQSRLSFEVPTTSDEVLQSEAVNCDGWIPKGADIEMIRVIDLHGLPKGSKWSCVSKNCSWRSGVKGSLILKTAQPLTKQQYSITVEIEGLGSMLGLSKWYSCEVELEL